MKKTATQAGSGQQSKPGPSVPASSQPVLDRDSAESWTVTAQRDNEPTEPVSEQSQNPSGDGGDGGGETAKAEPALHNRQVRESEAWSKRWKDQLRRLEPLDLPLLGCGADGADGRGTRKAPANLRNGSPLSGWQTAKHTAGQIASAHLKVICAGTRTGKAAHGLIAFDLDGETAVSWCLERGCDPELAQTWQVRRNTDASRLKVLFRLTEEQQQQLGQTKTKAETKAAIKDAKGKTIEAGEAVELFHGVGQVIVVGLHNKSKGYYFWPDGRGPEALALIPPCWWEAALEIVNPAAAATRSIKSVRNTSSGQWRNLTPCPICGRPDGWCQQTTDERPTVKCMHGESYSPPSGLKPGELHTDREGTVWAFSSSRQQSDGESYSVFVTPDPDKHKTVRSGHKRRQAPATRPQSVEAGKAIRMTPAQVMERLPEKVGTLQLNTRSRDITAGGAVMTGNAIARLYLQLSSNAESWPKEATYDAAVLLAEQNSFDPIADYLNCNTAEPLPMQQWQRLDRYLLGVDDQIAASFLPRYLIAAVARTFNPGCDFRQLPVLVGPQWIGKTALGRILFGSRYFVSGVGDLGKDALERCHTAWGVELAELDGITRRSDLEALKAFLSETCDSWRSPYDKATERRPRRFLFWGTSNGTALRDTTGNTRFVCIPVEQPMPLSWAERNRDAIWSRAVEEYRAGASWEECGSADRSAIAERNDNYQEEDPWLPAVTQHLEHRAAEQRLPVQVPELLSHVGLARERHSTRVGKRVQQLAESLGWRQDRRQIEGRRQRGLWPPVPHQCHTSGTPPNTNQRSGSHPCATPATPNPNELAAEAARRLPGDLSTRPSAAGTNGRSGVAGVAFAANTSQRSPFGGVPHAGHGASQAGHAATIPGLITPHPAPVGSGADVMDDDDDPHWPKRKAS